MNQNKVYVNKTIVYWYEKIRATVKKKILLLYKLLKKLSGLILTGLVLLRQFKIKVFDKKHQYELRKTPWYFVMGDKNTDKNCFIKNTGIPFYSIDHYNPQMKKWQKKFSVYNWFFSERVTFIYINQLSKQMDLKIWHNFLRVLKKERYQTPLQGVIVQFDFNELVQCSKEKLTEIIEGFIKKLNVMNKQLGTVVPLYLILTKFNLTDGFQDFFKNYSHDELQQVFGITIPLNIADNPDLIMPYIHREYIDIIKNLHKQIFWSFDTEKSLAGREKIINFPRNIQKVFEPIQIIILLICKNLSNKKQIKLRGIYFTGESENGICNEKDLINKQLQTLELNSESALFLQKLLKEVVYTDIEIFKEKTARKRIVTKINRYAIWFFPIIFLVFFYMFYSGYENIKQQMLSMQGQFNFICASKINQNNSNPILGALLVIKKLNKAKSIYLEQQSIVKNLFLGDYWLLWQFKRVQKKILQNKFLPIVAASLEKQLQHETMKVNLKYAMLKAYLFFGIQNHDNPKSVVMPMKYLWMDEFDEHPEYVATLTHALNESLKLPVAKLPLDFKLIRKIRDELESINTEQRAYDLLKLQARVSSIPDITLLSNSSAVYQQIFSRKKLQMIPALYTKTGFDNIFSKDYESIAKTVEMDNITLGLFKEEAKTNFQRIIAASLKKRYKEKYMATWRHALLKIKIKKVTALSSLILQLQYLLSNKSPMKDLLLVVNRNISGLSSIDNVSQVNVSELNYFINNKNSINYNAMNHKLKILLDYFEKIKHAKDSNFKAYQLLSKTFQSNTSPIIQLSRFANRTPDYIRNWLKQISANAWYILEYKSTQYLNQIWQKSVYKNYLNSLKDRYPLSINSNTQLSIKDFQKFFGSKGSIQSYYKEYLSPFVNIHTKHWELYQIDGFKFALAKSIIRFFELVNKINLVFFIQNNNIPGFNFTLEPIDLNQNVAEALISYGNHKVYYRHGPQNVYKFHWPMTGNNRISLIMTLFSNQNLAKNFSGPWSLFKFLNTAQLTYINHRQIKAKLDLKGKNLDLLITSEAGNNVFNLSLFKKIVFPKNINLTNV